MARALREDGLPHPEGLAMHSAHDDGTNERLLCARRDDLDAQGTHTEQPPVDEYDEQIDAPETDLDEDDLDPEDGDDADEDLE